MKTKKNIYFLILLITISYVCSVDNSKDIVEIKNDTISGVFKEYGKVLVMFYNGTSECPEQKKALEALSKIPSELKKESYLIAKIDGEKEKDLAKKYEIVRYPFVVLFILEVPYYYEGDVANEDKIVEWTRSKLRMGSRKIQTEDEIEKFVEENDYVIIYYGDDAHHIEMFKECARDFKGVFFAFCSDPKIMKKMNMTNGFLAFYQDRDLKNKEIKQFVFKKDVGNFIRTLLSPLDVRPEDVNLNDILFNGVPGIFYFPYKNSGNWIDSVELVNSVKKKIDIKLILVDVNIRFGLKICNYYGVNLEDLPQLLIIDPRKNLLKKYKSNFKTITEQNIIEFVNDFHNDKLVQFFRSGEPLAEEIGDIYTVVGKTFEKDIVNNEKDVVVLFFAPWCPHCKDFFPIYEKIARKFKKLKNKNVLFTKIDATENDIPNVFIKKYPGLAMYPGNKKNEAPIFFYEHKTEESVTEFIKKNAYNNINLEPIKKEKKSKNEDL